MHCVVRHTRSGAAHASAQLGSFSTRMALFRRTILGRGHVDEHHDHEHSHTFDMPESANRSVLATETVSPDYLIGSKQH